MRSKIVRIQNMKGINSSVDDSSTYSELIFFTNH
jgi:hypothetical protein